MTRAILCVCLSAACVVLALGTALVQNRNRTRAIALDALKEECSMIEAINGDRLEQILERDWAPMPYTPRTKPEPKKAPHAHEAKDATNAAGVHGRADS